MTLDFGLLALDCINSNKSKVLSRKSVVKKYKDDFRTIGFGLHQQQ